MIDNKIRSGINVLQWILIVFSGIALFFVFSNAFSLKFEFSQKGFNIFLGLFKPYSFLFGATFIVISANLALIRISIMFESNLKSYIASSRTVWMQTIKDFYDEIKSTDPYIVKEFNKDLAAIHDFLFEKNFKFDSRIALVIFFNRFVKDNVYLFEKMNTNLLKINCYPSENHSYSFPAFEYLIYVAVNYKYCYKDFRDDLWSMYMDEVKSVQKETTINQNMFNQKMNDIAKKRL